jgi:ABC-type Mn2+/Zn2+ transport system permease subunit
MFLVKRIKIKKNKTMIAACVMTTVLGTFLYLKKCISIGHSLSEYEKYQKNE